MFVEINFPTFEERSWKSQAFPVYRILLVRRVNKTWKQLKASEGIDWDREREGERERKKKQAQVCYQKP